MAKLLVIERVTAGYGDSIILEDVSLDLDAASHCLAETASARPRCC
jgi:ABC-type branched-subunit amino acid transport system ATPase component